MHFSDLLLHISPDLYTAFRRVLINIFGGFGFHQFLVRSQGFKQNLIFSASRSNHCGQSGSLSCYMMDSSLLKYLFIASAHQG